MRWLRTYLILAGVVGHVIAGVMLYRSDIDLPALASKAWYRGIDYVAQTTRSPAAPSAEILSHSFDGKLRETHPRILMPELASWNGQGQPEMFAKRQALWKQNGIPAYSPCKGGGLLGHVSCWVATGNVARGDAALAGIEGFRVKPPNPAGKPGNAWVLAFAYDLMRLNPDFGTEQRQAAEHKLEGVLKRFLTALDDEGASLWHGRASLATDAWLVASVLDPGTPERRELQTRTQAHFLDVMEALSRVEAWPEGYNYWINSRALTMVLAMGAYVNGLTDSAHRDKVLKVLERVGLWHVYGTRPDNRMSPVGDEGPRVDLKDETRRVVDLIAQITRKPLFASYSRYLASRHRHHNYYKDYQATFALYNDPEVELLASVKPGSLQGLGAELPAMQIFGRDTMNLAVVRTGWGPEDTFISFRAGSSLSHHGHYDAGHFTLFKGAPLASDSGTYGEFTKAHRLNYSIRTVAKNSLLILRPGEEVKPNRFFKTNVADGGQRVVIPTGSWIRNVADYEQNLGKGMHYEGGSLIGTAHQPDNYAYIAADLTGAYNNTRFDDNGKGGKVAEVKRELLYLFPEDRLIVHDKVVATDPEYTKKWLLHTIARPEVDGLAVLKGSETAGIMQSVADSALIKNRNSAMRLDRLYPEDAVMRVVGGKGYRFYVETDGDDSDLDGKNQIRGVADKKWFDPAAWRIEIQPGMPRKEDHFLVSLTPRTGTIAGEQDAARVLDIKSEDARALFTGKSLVIFVGNKANRTLQVTVPGQQELLYLAGVKPYGEVKVDAGWGLELFVANEAGLAVIPVADTREGKLKVIWQ